MSIASYLGISEDKSERLDSGVGTIFEHTLILGETVVVINSIGTMRLIDGKKSHAATILGGIIAIVGLITFSTSVVLGFLLLAMGSALAAWNIMKKVETYLSLGTSDGKTTFIVSTNRQFLHQVRDFLREKIDKKSSSGAIINITNSTLDGNFALGSGATALRQV